MSMHPIRLAHTNGRAFDALFDDLWSRTWQRPVVARTETPRVVPAMDVLEHADRFVVTVDLPGVQPEGLEVSVEEGRLLMKGTRTLDREAEHEGFKRFERRSTELTRALQLPEQVDLEGIQAQLAHGVLTVTVPKAPEVKPAVRRIEVTSTS